MSGPSPKGKMDHYTGFSKELGFYVNMVVHGDKVVRLEISREPAKDATERTHPYLARVLEHIRTGKDDLRDIPLELNVTAFEAQVLEVMRTIPPGKVLTYGEIAERLGRMNASRAVGNACAKNPVLIVVPCHRVVPSTGGLGNFSAVGGAATKKLLLQREGMDIEDKGLGQSSRSSSS